MRIALVVCLLFSSVAFAQAPSTFKEGVLAFEKGEWANAERLMRQTIAGNPKESEGTVSIAGSWYETYVPHYFLARALAKQGKCDEALKEFAESERQGVTPSIPDFARHLRTRGGCKPAPKQEKPARVIGEVEVPFEEDVSPPPVKTTTTTATVAPPSSQVKKLPERAVETKKPIDVEMRARLTAAVRAYIEGHYDVAVSVLSEKPFADRSAAAQAALFRAAARDALYRIGGARDDTLRVAVDSDLRLYRELRSNRAPDARLFPPSFIAKVNAQ